MIIRKKKRWRERERKSELKRGQIMYACVCERDIYIYMIDRDIDR